MKNQSGTSPLRQPVPFFLCCRFSLIQAAKGSGAGKHVLMLKDGRMLEPPTLKQMYLLPEITKEYFLNPGAARDCWKRPYDAGSEKQ